MEKLVLHAEKQVINLAKQLADDRHISISEMFSEYVLSASDLPRTKGHSPKTLEATGLVKFPKDKTDRQLIEEALAERFG